MEDKPIIRRPLSDQLIYLADTLEKNLDRDKLYLEGEGAGEVRGSLLALRMIADLYEKEGATFFDGR